MPYVHQSLNEMSIIAKFVANSLVSDTWWSTTYPGARFFEEVIPVGIKVTTVAAMFVNDNTDDDLGAFGYRLKSTGLYQIKAVIEGSDFSLIANAANTIDRIFDWQNTIDVNAGRPKCQQLYVDPDLDPQTNQNPQIMIMGMIRRKALKYTTFVDGVNYCHQGGQYEIQYYQP